LTQQPVAEIEFEDEEQLATVTVVEDFDAVDLKMLSSGYDDTAEEKMARTPTVAKKPPRPNQPPKTMSKSKLAKPKFRNGSKAAGRHGKTKRRGRREERSKLKNRSR
jgi:ribosomal RNA-processing protein 17